ncbi:MAG: rhodanese family protein [Pseudomonadota bacterium]
MTARLIQPEEAHDLITRKNAKLIDIRSKDEFAREHIEGAQSLPLDQLADAKILSGPVIFHCRSGNRTAMSKNRLSAATNGDCYILEGGMDAWKTSGMTTQRDTSQPIEIMRQVQITAGILILIGVFLGLLIAPQFFAIAAFVGAGLTFAGATGWCGMAKFLALMPWNQRAIG